MAFLAIAIQQLKANFASSTHQNVFTGAQLHCEKKLCEAFSSFTQQRTCI